MPLSIGSIQEHRSRRLNADRAPRVERSGFERWAAHGKIAALSGRSWEVTAD